jgi:hypothetical protein
MQLSREQKRVDFIGPIGPIDRLGALSDIECFDAFVLVDKNEIPYWEVMNRTAKVAKHKRRSNIVELTAAYAALEGQEISPFAGSDDEYNGPEASDWE